MLPYVPICKQIACLESIIQEKQALLSTLVFALPKSHPKRILTLKQIQILKYVKENLQIVAEKEKALEHLPPEKLEQLSNDFNAKMDDLLNGK